MRTTLPYTIVSSTISNMLDYATLKMVQGNSETGRNVFKAPRSTMFPNIRFYLLCLFYCLWIQVFPFTPPFFFSFGCFISYPCPQDHPPLSSFLFFLSLTLDLTVFFLLSYCLLCFIVVGAVKFFHEKFIAAIQNVLVSLGGSI